MAGHTRDFTHAGLPKLEDGIPFVQGFRHALQYRATVTLAIGDDIYINGNVPDDEFWQVRQFFVSDSTGPVGANGQGWQKQALRFHLSQRESPIATAAAPTPAGDFVIPTVPQWVPIWRRDWDGVTYLAWVDANGALLLVSEANPVWSANVWLPGTRWQFDSRSCEFATVGAQAFYVQMIVDRWQMPLDVFEKNIRRDPLLLPRAVHLAGYTPLLKG